MRGLFEAGALPRTYATTSNDDEAVWMQQGRAAFTVYPFARYAQLNRADQSRFPGQIKAVEFPVSEKLKGKRMETVTEFWAMSIPANSRDKDLGWSFIRAMSSKAVTLGAARNGNGPVRLSTYRDPAFAASQPLAEIEFARIGDGARPPARLPRGGPRAVHLHRGSAALRHGAQVTETRRSRNPRAGSAAYS